jgi:hypothetical protein
MLCTSYILGSRTSARNRKLSLFKKIL